MSKEYVLYGKNKPNTYIGKKYEQGIGLIEQDTPISRVCGTGKNIAFVLETIGEVPVSDKEYEIAIDAAATGITMAYKEKGVKRIPSPVSRSGQNRSLTPVKEENIDFTCSELGREDRDIGLTSAAICKVNHFSASSSHGRESTIARYGMIYDKKLLAEIMVSNTSNNDGMNLDPIRSQGIYANPKEQMYTCSVDTEEYQMGKNSYTMLLADALIRAVRSFPDISSDKIKILISRPGTDNDLFMTAINEGVRIANEHLGRGFLRDNCYYPTEADAAVAYYRKYGLPNGRAIGSNFVTIDIGASTVDVSVTLGDVVRKEISIPYAGNQITSQSAIETGVYGMGKNQFDSIFDTKSNKDTDMILKDAGEYLKREYSVRGRSSRCDIAVSPTANAYFELLTGVISSDQRDNRVFIMTSRTKLMAIQKMIGDILASLTEKYPIPEGENLNLIILGRGAKVYENLNNGGSPLLDAWKNVLNKKCNTTVDIHLSTSSEKIELVYGMLAFEHDGNGKPVIPDKKKDPSAVDRYEYYAHILDREDLLKRVKVDELDMSDSDAARNELENAMFYHVLKSYTFDDYKNDLSDMYIKEMQSMGNDLFVDNKGNSRKFYSLLMDEQTFNQAKIRTKEDGRSFVLSNTGMERALLFLKLTDWILRLSLV